MYKFLIFILLVIPFSIKAQEIETKIDTTKIKIGQPVKLIYTVNFSKGDVIKLPSINDTLSYHIEVLDQKIDTITEGKQQKIMHRLDLTSFDAGNFLIKSLLVEKNNEKLRTKSFELEVEDVVVDSTKNAVFPIKPVMEEKYNAKDLFNKYWIYGLVALIIFIVVAILVYLYIRAKSKILNIEKEKTPYEEVIFNLNNLYKKNLLEKDDQREYYTQLSYFVRNYIGKVYKFPALELLSDDLANKIYAEEDITKEDKQMFKNFLSDADLAKFAKEKLTKEKNNSYRNWIDGFVERIKPIELPVEDTNATEDRVTGDKYKKWDNS